MAILVGGMGTRLRGVVDGIPKPLAPVLGRPFLFYILDRLALRGARSVVLCCGYRADAIRAAVGTDWLGMPVRFSLESQPLGTGGALKNAASLMESERIVAMNGDSWFEPDWNGFLKSDPGIPAWIASVDVPDSSRYGTMEILDKRVMAFREKSSEPGPINAGIYLIDHSWLQTLHAGSFSLERDIFPHLAISRRLGAFPGSGPFLDIGVPEDYQTAGQFLEKIGVAPHPMLSDFPHPL